MYQIVLFNKEDLYKSKGQGKRQETGFAVHHTKWLRRKFTLPNLTLNTEVRKSGL